MKTLMLPEDLLPMRLYADSCILQDAFLEQNLQGRSESYCESSIVTRIYCLEPSVLPIFVKNNKFVYSQLLCKYHGITEGAVPDGKKCQCYGKQRKGSSVRRQERTKMLAVMGIFFCD